MSRSGESEQLLEDINGALKEVMEDGTALCYMALQNKKEEFYFVDEVVVRKELLKFENLKRRKNIGEDENYNYVVD